MSSIKETAQSWITGLSPYVPGKPIEDLQRELGIDDIIKLASNENPLGPSPRALAAIRDELTELALYPDGSGYNLRKALAQKHGVAMEQITLGDGSSEILELTARIFGGPGREVIFSRHAFAMYPILTQAVGATAVEVPAKEWGHDLPAMLAAITERTRLIFVANPNNPTGTYLKSGELLAFLEQVPQRVVVVVDEAYFDFARYADTGAEDYPDAMAWLDRFPNLLVARTFSKAYGLAGLRIGYGVCNKELADLLNRLRPPFNINSLALVAANAALGDQDYLEQGLAVNAAGLHQLMAGFDTMGLSYISSVGNFISVDVGREGALVYDGLLREGVIVRPVANYAMPNFLRVTVGTAEQNERFLSALAKVLAS